MSKLKSGVYFVRYKDIDKFFQDIEKNGWDHKWETLRYSIYNTLCERGHEEKIIEQLVIPFSLDKNIRIACWPKAVCLESEVEEAMTKWDAWFWTDRHIEFYQSKKLII